MITPGLAARVMFGLCLSLACSLPPCIAQSTPADQLREQLETVLAKDDLSPLDKVRQLRKLIDREETVLLEKAVAEWVEQLGGTDFASREVAQRNLIEAGPLAIAAVTRGARRDDRERAERCLNVLAALAKSEDEAIAGNAMEALQRLAKASTPIGLRAAKTVAELNETDADRALAVLARLGVNVHKDAEGEVTMITAIAPRFHGPRVETTQGLSTFVHADRCRRGRYRRGDRSVGGGKGFEALVFKSHFGHRQRTREIGDLAKTRNAEHWQCEDNRRWFANAQRFEKPTNSGIERSGPDGCRG